MFFQAEQVLIVIQPGLSDEPENDDEETKELLVLDGLPEAARKRMKHSLGPMICSYRACAGASYWIKLPHIHALPANLGVGMGRDRA